MVVVVVVVVVVMVVVVMGIMMVVVMVVVVVMGMMMVFVTVTVTVTTMLPWLRQVCLADHHPSPGSGPPLSQPCLPCHCSPEGSSSTQCDQTGQCPCR